MLSQWRASLHLFSVSVSSSNWFRNGWRWNELSRNSTLGERVVFATQWDARGGGGGGCEERKFDSWRISESADRSLEQQEETWRRRRERNHQSQFNRKWTVEKFKRDLCHFHIWHLICTASENVLSARSLHTRLKVAKWGTFVHQRFHFKSVGRHVNATCEEPQAETLARATGREREREGVIFYPCKRFMPYIFIHRRANTHSGTSVLFFF